MKIPVHKIRSVITFAINGSMQDLGYIKKVPALDIKPSSHQANVILEQCFIDSTTSTVLVWPK